MKTDETLLRKKLKHYCSKRFRNINARLEDYLVSENLTPLHRLRVEIKKLLAVVHLIEYSRKHPFDKSDFAALRKIFKLSGKLRSAAIAQNIQNKFCRDWPYEYRKPLIIEIAKNKLRAKHKKYKRQLKVAEKKYLRKLRHVDFLKLRRYTGTKSRIIEQFLQKPHITELHNTRKAIKEVQYLSKFQYDNNSTKGEKAQLNFLKRLGDEIGDWHDLDKFIEMIKKNSGPDAYNIPLRLRQEYNKRLNRITKEISAHTGKETKFIDRQSCPLVKTTGGIPL